MAWRTERFSLLESGWAVPPAGLLALVALGLARRARRRARRSVLPVAGLHVARTGRVVGWLGLYVAATATLALGVYAVETYLSR
ncbi:MAG: hypothetical protein ABR583_03520 [Gaiellaceae bacterium]